MVADGSYFLVTKSPPEGGVHIFQPGEPFAQILVLPEEASFDLAPMSEEEAAERELQSRRIYQSRSTLSAETEWTSATNTVTTGPIGISPAQPTRSRSGSAAASEAGRGVTLVRAVPASLAARAQGSHVVMMMVMVVAVVMVVVVMISVMVVVMMMVILGQLDRLRLGSSSLLVLALEQADGVRDGVQQLGEGLRRLQPAGLAGGGDGR